MIKFLVADWVRTTNVHHHTNFTKIDQTIILHLTIIKMVALRHLGFSKIYLFEQLVSSGELICVIVQNFNKIGQTILKISQFFDFQDGRRPPSWILKLGNFWSPIRSGDLIYIAVPNFTKISQTIAEISHLTIFKMAAIRHLEFKKN